MGFSAFESAFRFRFNNVRSTAAYDLSPMEQGINYVAPRANDTGAQKCECDTVMFRYVTILPHSLSKHRLLSCVACIRRALDVKVLPPSHGHPGAGLVSKSGSLSYLSLSPRILPSRTGLSWIILYVLNTGGGA